MPQGSPKSVAAVNRPVTLSTNYSRNAPTLTRQHTWTNLDSAPTQSRRGHNDGTAARTTRGGINKRKKRRKSRRKKRRKSRKSRKRRRSRRRRRR